MHINNFAALKEVKAKQGVGELVDVELKLEAPVAFVELGESIESSISSLTARWNAEDPSPVLTNEQFTIRCKLEGPRQYYTFSKPRDGSGRVDFPSVETGSMVVKIEDGNVVVGWTAKTSCLPADVADVVKHLGETRLRIEDLQQELPLDGQVVNFQQSRQS